MKIIVWYLIILFLFGCSDKILPTKPNVGELSVIKERTSSVVLPISAKVSDIRALLEKEVPNGLIHHQGRISGFDGGDIRIYRDGQIGFSTSANTLRFAIPILVDVYAVKKKNVLGAKFSKTGKGKARLTLYLDINVNLDSTYKFHSTSNISYNLSQAEIKISLLGDIGKLIGDPHVKISVRDLVRPKLEEKIRDYIPRINKIVEDELNSLDLRKEIEPYWSILGKPVEVDSNIWLSSQPTNIYFDNIQSNNELITVKAGLGAKLKMVLGPKPNEYNNPIPNLKVDQDLSGKFDIYLPAILSFDEMQKIINNEVAGKRFISEKNDYDVKIRDVRLFGAKNIDASVIVCGISFTGRARGTRKRAKGVLWFYMVPAYDAEKNVVYIADFKLTPQTNSIILNKGYPWLIDKFYMDKLLEKARYDFSKDLNDLKQLIAEKIQKVEVDKLSISGELNGLEFIGFNITEDNLSLVITANGSIDSKPVKLE